MKTFIVLLVIITTLLLGFFFSATEISASSCLSGAEVPLLYEGSANKTMPGFYSPELDPSNSTTFNVACTPTPACAAIRSLGKVCEDSQSPYEPRECDIGYYCPTYSQQLECPEGHYCLLGTFKPEPCPPLSLCPAGSVRPRYFGGLILLVCLLAIVVGAIIWYEKIRSPAPPSETVENASLSARKKMLNKAVKRARVETQTGMDSVKFEFKDLSVSVKVEGKTDPVKILNGVSGVCEPGCVSSVMGPSGAGKSTFVKALLRRFDSDEYIITGENMINGSSDPAEFEKVRNAISYIPQDDVLHNELTVKDNVFYASELGLPRNWTAEEREEFREVVLSLVGLSRHRNTKVGSVEERGLSGGQRKRCAIATQMSTASVAIFADELTSGLDSTTSVELMRVLKEVAVAAKIAIVIIVHQPPRAIWDVLDRLLLLAPGGRTVFEGPANQATTVLGEYLHLRPQDNPADVLMDAVAIHGQEMAKRWEAGELSTKLMKSESSQESLEEDLSTSSHPLEYRSSSQQKYTDVSSVAEESSVRQAHPFKQFLIMHLRVLQKILANYQFLFLEWIILLLTGFILGSAGMELEPKATYRVPYDRISYQAVVTFLPQMLMYTKMSAGLAGSVSSVGAFGNEKVRFRRESETGLSVTAYYFAVTLAMIYRSLISSTIFSALIHFMGQWPTDYWTTIFPNLFLVYLCFNSIGEIVSLLTTSEYSAVIASMLALLASVLNGFISFPYWLKVLSFAYWSSQQLYDAWYSQVEHISTPPYERWDYKPDEFSGADCLGIMAANFIVYNFIVWAILMWQHR